MADQPETDPFLLEVLSLFAQEAQEWTTRTQAALQELEQTPPAARKLELVESLVCGMTNLGGSAATVEQPALEQAAFALLPLLEVIRERNVPVSRTQLEALRGGHDFIMQVIGQLEKGKPATTDDLPAVLARLSEAAKEKPEPVAAAKPSPPSTADRPALLEALRERQRSQEHADGRRVIDAVLRRIQTDDAAAVRKVLDEIGSHDDRFLEEVRRRVPVVAKGMTKLEGTNGAAPDRQSLVPPLLEEVDHLREAARAADAAILATFFHGLHTFLHLSARNAIPIVPQRFKAVAARLQHILPQAEQWANTGKSERATLQTSLHL